MEVQKNIDNMYWISTSSGSDDENNVFILKGNNKVRVVASRFRPDEAIKRLVDDEETIQDITIETDMVILILWMPGLSDFYTSL